jgi:VanZ family protein
VIWTILLLRPMPSLGDQLGPTGEFMLAKALHVGVYAGLTVLIAFMRLPVRWCWVGIGLLSLHAFLTEWGQTMVPGRFGSLRDVAIDHLGIVLGGLLAWRWWRKPILPPVQE